mgnify:CR=1 FL=1|tara:strand:- start:1516 stop:1755 length:240 start_codon:yes stop_codon:yes gene_type:complete
MIIAPRPEIRSGAHRALEVGAVFAAHSEAMYSGRCAGFCVACHDEQEVTAEDIDGDRCQACGTLAVASAALLILSGYLG